MIIAITGGIGSGKSVVSQLLRVMGYTVYDCDRAAQQLMLHDATLRQQLTEAFGADTYLPDGQLNRPHLSAAIFGHPERLEQMNALVHPAVARDCLSKLPTEDNTPTLYFVESAILYESGFDLRIHPDQVWSVSAPLELRIERAMLRDDATRQQIEARIGSQMPQEEKNKKATAVIFNDNCHSIIQQVNTLLATLVKQLA